MEAIGDIREVVARIDEGLVVRREDVARGAALLDSFYFAPPADVHAAVMEHGAGSWASYQAQMKLIFEPIAGHVHSMAMEGLDTFPDTPTSAFPFTLAPVEAGMWTMAYGYFIHVLNLPAGAKVLEIGAGPGGLTELMARSGLDVSVVEVRESNCRLIRNRGQLMGVQISAHCVDVNDLKLDEQFDAIVFYESFHHMAAPAALLERLRPLLKPGGRFAFGAEPIQPPGPLIPFPWGFRMNGASLGALRDVGWLEFGFNEDFFRALLRGMGMTIDHHILPGFNYCDVWIGRLG